MIAALANHLWQCTLFAAAAALVALWLDSCQAKVRFWVWFAASMKFVLPFSLLIAFGAHTASSPARYTASPTVLSSGAVLLTQPFGSTPVTAQHPLLFPPKGRWLLPVLASIWILGSLVIANRRWRDWRLIRSALRSSTSAPIAAQIEVRYCPLRLEPAVVGVLRPVLLLPVGIAELLNTEQLDAVLAHEICHVRRNDNLLASFHILVEFLFWYHPLVWWIGARLIQERERACDEEVLRGGTRPAAYATGILAVCRLYAHMPLATASGVTGCSLRKRIEEIMNHRQLQKLGLLRTLALIALAFALLAVPIFTGMRNPTHVLAQSTSAVHFQTVSIRACRDLPGTKKGNGYSSSAFVLSTGCMPLADQQGLGLIQRAYVRFSPDPSSNWPAVVPVKGTPSWFEELYELIGTAPPNTPRETMEGPMLRAALEDRFKLRIREDSAEVPVYSLRTGSPSPPLNPFTEGSCVAMPAAIPPPQLPAGQRYCMLRAGSRPPAIDAEGASLATFSQLLSLVMDRPVIDQTEISGRFTIHLAFAPGPATPRFLAGGDLARFATPPAPGTPSISQALEQFGLRLEPGTAPQKQLVIDHVEKPVLR